MCCPRDSPPSCTRLFLQVGPPWGPLSTTLRELDGGWQCGEGTPRRNHLGIPHLWSLENVYFLIMGFIFCWNTVNKRHPWPLEGLETLGVGLADEQVFGGTRRGLHKTAGLRSGRHPASQSCPLVLLWDVTLWMVVGQSYPDLIESSSQIDGWSGKGLIF